MTTDFHADPVRDTTTPAAPATGDDANGWIWHETAVTWERTDGSGESWTWDDATQSWRETGPWRWDAASGAWVANPDWHGGLAADATPATDHDTTATPDATSTATFGATFGATSGAAADAAADDAGTTADTTSQPTSAPTSRPGGRHGTRRTLWIAVGLVAAAVVVGVFALFPGVFGIGNPADPQAYIPATIDGRPVQDEGPILGIMQSAFIGGAKYRQGEVQVAAGLIETKAPGTTTAPPAAGTVDNRFPELVVMAVRRLGGPPLSPTLENALGGGAESVERVVIDGVPAKVFRNDSFGEGTVFVEASPRDDLVLLALAFAPTDEVIPDSAVAEQRAISAIEAMLEQANS